MTQLVRTGYLLGTSSRRVLFNSASFALDFTTGFYKNAAGYVRTNLALQSDARGTAPWTVQAGAVANANGLSVFTESTASATHNTYQSTTVASGATVTFSANLAAGSRRYVQLGVGNGANSFWITVDTSNWTITEATNSGTSTLTGYALVPVGGGIYRAHVTGALAGQTTYFFAINGTLSAAGGGNAPAYLGTSATIITRGVQFETTSYPTSYIPTGASPASVTTYTSTNPADVGNMTFTRASGGYAEDVNGNLVWFPSGVPRITNKGYLAEEARTNVALWSQDTTNAWWSKLALTASISGTAPDGTLTANVLTVNTSSTSVKAVYRLSGVTYVSGAAYTTSWYVKPGPGVRYVQLPLANAAFSGSRYANFDLQTGTVGTTSANVTASIVPSAGGWFRVSVTSTATGSVTNDGMYVFIVDSGSASFIAASAAPSGSVLNVWGAQFEVGGFTTSYIPTTSASVTRPADVFYYPSTSIPLQNAMTFVAQTGGVANISSARWLLQTGADTTNNRIGLAANVAPTTMIPRYVQAGLGKSPSDITGILSISSDNVAAIAFSIGGNVRAGANGLLSATPGGDPVALPSQGNFNVGADNAGSGQFNGYIKRIAVYPFAASDAQLQSLSSGNFLL